MKDNLPTGLRLLGVDEDDYEVMKRVISSIGSFEEFELEVRELRGQVESALLKIEVMNQLLYQLHPAEYQAAVGQVAETRANAYQQELMRQGHG